MAAQVGNGDEDFDRMEKAMEMTGVSALLDRHQGFVEQFESGDLGIPPRLSTIILTCVDARVDPAHLFSLAPGDALVIRNTGGRVTRGVLTDLAVLGVLSANWPGATGLELVVIPHTDCGMARLANPDIRQKVAGRLGLTDDEVAAMAITDPAATVRNDIERLRTAPAVPPLVVSGFVYDVADGSLTEVVPPTSLRVID